jgi:hypothetical protein
VTLRTARRIATTTAVAALLAPLAAAPAAAESVGLADPRGDTWTTNQHYEWERHDGRSQADLTRVRIAHNEHAVVVRARYAHLNRTGLTFQLGASIRTDQGKTSYATVRRDRGQWRGTSGISERRRPQRDCGVTHRIDYERDVVRLRIPRECLDGPRWVRLQVRTSWGTHEDTVTDNPHNTRAHPQGWTRRLPR